MSPNASFPRRRFLGRLCLLALPPCLAAAPALARQPSETASVSLPDASDPFLSNTTYGNDPFYLRHDPSALSWLADHLRDHLPPGDRARVFAAALHDDPVYPFLWVPPGKRPDFRTVLAYLDTGEIPAHQRGLRRCKYGICCERPSPPPPLS